MPTYGVSKKHLDNLGVFLISIKDGIYIVPNPNNGKFNIVTDVADAFSITIYDNIGQVVHTTPTAKSNVTIDLEIK